MPSQSLPIDRAALGQFIRDPRTLVAMERALQLALQVSPDQIAALQALLDAAQMVVSVADPDFPAARVLTGSTGVSIDTATAGLIKVLVNVATALGYTPANAADDFVTFAAPSGDLSGARRLSGGTGVTVDIATAGLAKVVVNALAILNAAAINLTQPVTASGGVAITGGLECDGLSIDATPAATTTASDHSIPINCNGVTYYVRLSTAP